MWCVAELDEEYIGRMEDILAVYEKPLSEREPVVGVDEKPVVLPQEVRPPLAMRPGRVARWRIAAVRHRQRVRRSRTESGAVLPQDDGPPLCARVCRLHAAGCDPLPGGGHHPLGARQSEFAYAQGGGGTLRREGRKLAVGSVYGALHSQARQLAEPSRDRDPSVFAAMPRPAPDRRSGFSAKANSRLEPPYESPSPSDPMEIHSQEGSDHL